MKIEGTPGQELASAYLWLARSEAVELRDALNDMLASEANPNWHAHIPAADYAAEVTLSWEIDRKQASAPDG
jgi:hypothetical protein